MDQNDNRIDEFRKEIDELNLKGSSASSERWMLALGALLAIAGVVLGIVGAVNTINAGDSPADQRAFIASGSLLGLVLVIAGAALFVRFSMGRYMRYWLIRMVYEGRADTDRLVAAIDRASGAAEPTGAQPTPAQPAASPPPQGTASGTVAADLQARNPQP